MIWEAEEQKHLPVRLIDANGREWFDVCWFDTETGQGERLIINNETGFELDREGNLKRKSIQMAVPVQILSPLS